MHTTFWKITKDLYDSDTDFKMLEIFNVNDIKSVMQHLISFIGCEPFLKEMKKIKGDIEKYTEFQQKSKELLENTMDMNEDNTDSCQ